MSELPAAPEEQALAATLAQLDLGAAAPPPLAQAVAAALAWVDRLGHDATGPGGVGGPDTSPRDRVG